MVSERLFRTVNSMDAVAEPPWMDSRRVLKSLSETNAWECKTELSNTIRQQNKGYT